MHDGHWQMRLYFVRHGESTANLLREFSNSGWNHPLTKKGVEQARTAARGLAGVKVERVYSSPVMRAAQTAQILAESLQAPLELAEALREWSVGIYEGTTDPAGWELHRQVQDDWFVHHKLDSRMPGGESFLDVRERFVPFVEGLVRTGRNADRNIVLVGHGGLYIAMLPAVFQNVDWSFARQQGFPNTGCALAEARPDGLHCVSWCGVALDPSR
jgi:broad specificity phosphatase PhoE